MSIQTQIEDRLRKKFRVQELRITNESRRHRLDPGGETHFRVLLVAPEFEGQGLVARHRSIYEALAEEMAAGIHALTLELRTPIEWEKDPARVSSPPCANSD